MTKQIASLERLRNSRDGNPTWRVEFTDGTVATTAKDAAVGNAIDNSEYQGVPLEVTFDGDGAIRSVEVAEVSG
ncbi:hypothetical protein [Microbacterium trichothecenolyticum]|uniref:Uncharacterized protein n=1 Tax=Microbacterium trichothecenolyticum TaxID=69370 RepID=A0A0M2HFW4_MICTR|nr:hypothetical protein [Microbacterium trichothecenolyticum]KJL45567.1 hypothetical protein RS82_00119 [Microbacterium trichothecenolyticum]